MKYNKKKYKDTTDWCTYVCLCLHLYLHIYIYIYIYIIYNNLNNDHLTCIQPIKFSTKYFKGIGRGYFKCE